MLIEIQTIESRIDDIAYKYINNEKDAEEYTRLRRKQELMRYCQELGLDSLDWNTLIVKGRLCKRDFNLFPKELDGLTWQEANRVYRQCRRSDNGE